MTRVEETIREYLYIDERIPQYIHVTAIQYYQQLYDADVSKNGFHIIRRATVFTATIAACAYYAFKHHDMPRTPKEICTTFGISRQLFSKGCHHCAIIQTLPLRRDTAELLFTRFANQLGLPYRTIRYAIDNLYEPAKPAINKYKPAAVAGGLICTLIDINQHDSSCVIYKHLTLRDVCIHVGVCTSIVRSIKQVLFTSLHHDEEISRDREFDAMFNEFFSANSTDNSTSTHVVDGDGGGCGNEKSSDLCPQL